MNVTSPWLAGSPFKFRMALVTHTRMEAFSPLTVNAVPLMPRPMAALWAAAWAWSRSKRLADAVDDGDHIYAAIRGSAMNNDGITRVSYAAPGLNGQATVIMEAMAAAEIDPESISYIETHGTGTPLGDSVELEAMIQAFRQSTDKKTILSDRLGQTKHWASRPRIWGNRTHQNSTSAQKQTTTAQPQLRLTQSGNRLGGEPLLCQYRINTVGKRMGMGHVGLGSIPLVWVAPMPTWCWKKPQNRYPAMGNGRINSSSSPPKVKPR